ncbi:TonB-dependent receptor domain-containing protein [Marinobacter bohaiensis]|uniref:TonB-dependent receptor domain-containing protein n=1 Tax=Marinobacter bohaiensis TaxID=2201898 RepID=UPI000DAB879F|nr:TonB-dependent receptor [Marinobacter bohaiensis]
MNKPFSLAAGLMTGCLAAPLNADILNPLVVTATRTAQTADEVNASVTVISRQDIQRSTASSIEDLLRGVPGVTVSQSGGAGKQSSVFMRGSNSDHVLVLVDGLKVGGATAGTAQLENIPLALVDRIEVVRGPRSSLYGSEAIGGVIQIFTRRGTPEPEAISEVSAGTEGTSRLTQHFSGRTGDTAYSLSASMYETDGVDSQPVSNQRDDDGFESQSFSASVDQRVNDRLSLGLNAMHAQGENDYDSVFGTADQRYWNEFVQQSGRVFADFAASDDVTLHAQIGYGREDNDNFIDQADYFDYETRRRQYLVQSDAYLTGHQLLTVGVERVEERVEASTAYTEDARYNNAVFGQWQTVDQPLHVETSLRYDNNQAYGDETTGAVSVGYQLTPALKPYVSYGTGFKAPNFNDLYSPFGANPDLDAETSETYEVGLKGSVGRLSYEWAAYRTNFDDLIQLDALFIPYNTESATAEGTELSVIYRGGDWRLEMGAGYTRATDDDTGDALARRPKWNGRLAGTKTFGPLEASLEWLGRTDSVDTAADSDIPGYGMTNLTLAYAATDRLDLTLKGRNLLDQEAVTVAGYSGQQRALLASLRYSY